MSEFKGCGKKFKNYNENWKCGSYSGIVLCPSCQEKKNQIDSQQTKQLHSEEMLLSQSDKQVGEKSSLSRTNKIADTEQESEVGAEAHKTITKTSPVSDFIEKGRELTREIEKLKGEVIHRIMSAEWLKTKFDGVSCLENEFCNPIIRELEEFFHFQIYTISDEELTEADVL